jgi:hypothetical protein
MANNVKKAIIAWGDDEHLRNLKADDFLNVHHLPKQ